MSSLLPLTGFGTNGLPEGGRVDFGRLRADRRRRLFAAMEDDGIDVLVLGRAANIAFASGGRPLWTAGTRPFGPGCIVVRSTGRVHLLSTWDEGLPAEIGHDDIFGLSWNPAIVMSKVKAIPGLDGAGQVGTDGWAPGTDQMGAALFPGAELIDGGPTLARARSPKSVDELVCIQTAAALAESALTALVGALRATASERHLVGVYASHLAALGTPAPPTEGVVCATSSSGVARLRRFPATNPIEAGQLVAFNPFAFYAGYEGGLARTVVTGGSRSAAQSELIARAAAALSNMMGACVPGATGADLCRAWETTGEPFPGEPLARGVGIGAELPVIGPGLGQAAVLGPGTVLYLQAWVAEDGVGGALDGDLVLITEEGPSVLTRYRR